MLSLAGFVQSCRAPLPLNYHRAIQAILRLFEFVPAGAES
jgi:hypothetical protein